MTGLYRESIKKRRASARADVRRIQHYLAALQYQGSDYAEEHRQLLRIFQQVAAIYDAAPDDIQKDGYHAK